MDLAEIIIRKLGIDPEQLKAVFTAFVQDAAAIKSEVGAAKKGFIEAAQAFDARLAAIEANQEQIMRSLGLTPPELKGFRQTPASPNRVNGGPPDEP